MVLLMALTAECQAQEGSGKMKTQMAMAQNKRVPKNPPVTVKGNRNKKCDFVGFWRQIHMVPGWFLEVHRLIDHLLDRII